MQDHEDAQDITVFLSLNIILNFYIVIKMPVTEAKLL